MNQKSYYDDDEPLEGLLERLSRISVAPLWRHFLKEIGLTNLSVWGKLEATFPPCISGRMGKLFPQRELCHTIMTQSAAQCNSFYTNCSALEQKYTRGIKPISTITRPIWDRVQRSSRHLLQWVLDIDRRVQAEKFSQSLKRVDRFYILPGCASRSETGSETLSVCSDIFSVSEAGF